MTRLPLPDPSESHEPAGIELASPAAIFLGGPPSPHADRLASALLDWRPGALLVVSRT